MIPPGSTCWLCSDNPYVPEQFPYKEALETHLFIVWKIVEQTLVLKWQPHNFRFIHNPQQNAVHSLKPLACDPVQNQGQG